MADPRAVASTCHYVGFCALKTADQAAWASAIGTIAAAVVALGIALSGGVLRLMQRRKDAIALAAYLSPDLERVCSALDSAIDYVKRLLDGNEDFLMKADLAGFAATKMADLQGAVLESKVDRFGLLPGRTARELASAVGSLGRCRDAVSKFAVDIRRTVPGQWEEFSAPILAQFTESRRLFERARIYGERAAK